MKNIIFTVSSVEKSAFASVINGLKSYSGQCRIDFVSNKISVDIAEDEKVDEIITFVSQNYTIFRVDIADKEDESKTAGESVVNFLEGNDFSINGICYNSEKVKLSLEKLFKVMNLAFASTSKITTEDIAHYIDTCKHELIMKYNPIPRVRDISVGDIVAINYGMHAGGELSGEILSVVCANYDNMICVVPILRTEEIDASNQKCVFDWKEGIYLSWKIPKGILMFDRAQFVRCERVLYSVGKISTEYLKEIQCMLAHAFDFFDK